jgi:hypothetical protein
MEAIPSWEASLRSARLEGEKQEARRLEEEEREVEAARTNEVLRRQRALLVEHLQSWERAERLRRYVAAVISSARHSQEMLSWAEWANAQIQALDPLQSNLQAVLNLAIELEEYYTGPSSWERPSKDWWS